MVGGRGQGLVGHAEDRGFSGDEMLSTLQCEETTQLLGGDGREWGEGGPDALGLAEVHPAMVNLLRLFPTCVSKQGSWDVNQETCQRAWQMMASQEIPASSFLLPRYRAGTCCRNTPAPSLEPQQAKLPL